MNIVSQKPGANQNIQAKEVIIAQGSMPTSLVVLNQGRVSFKMATGGKEQNLLAAAKLLFLNQGPAVLGGGSLASSSAYPYYVVAETPCVVSVYPSNKENLLALIQSKPSVAVLLLKSLLKEAMESFQKMNMANSFLSQIMKMLYSVCLGYSVIDPSQFQERSENLAENGSKGGFLDPVLPQARVIVKEFIEQGGAIPDRLTSQFMYADHTGITGHTYDPEIDEVKNEINYARHFMSLPPELIAGIAQKSPAFLVLTAQKIQGVYKIILDDISGISMQIRDDLEALMSGEYSWLSKILLQVELFEKKASAVSHENIYAMSYFIVDAISKLSQNYQKLWYAPVPPMNNDAFQKVKMSLQKKPQQQPKPVVSSVAGVDSAKALGELQGSAQKIFSWCGLSKEKFAEYNQGIMKLKALSNPLDSDSDARKLRRVLNALFWEAYEKGMLKYVKTKEQMPKLMHMFFNFGFLDETLLEEEHLVYLYANMVKDENSKYPVYTALEWLTMIYEKKVPTSINELGLTFFEILKNEHKDSKWKKETDVPDDIDTPEARLKYELKNMIEPCSKLTSGSVMNHFAILSKYQITQGIDRSLVTKKILSEQIDALLEKDFGVFHREVLFENEESGISREFVQIRVVPNIILVPSAGPIFQHWQEREGKNRSSKGRLICPHLSMADLYSMLLNAAGTYRWEMLKTTLGIDWNNVSQSSLTADYVDYVQFFKKNRELSPEVKEKLGAEFKRFRDDRSRFVHDYGVYVKFESEGTQRLNKVARKIFTKHVPFSKKYREHLLTLPSYTDMVSKSQNIKKRKAMELEPRYKKYQQSTGELPQELKETLKYYLGDY
ncbi:MAG: cyclic nucleotide-binding domain-containing protein [Spirochaetia bacterium]|nr:cyclic nucleotide-binding domain-containing protein [Spirochaetia bacterium]